MHRSVSPWKCNCRSCLYIYLKLALSKDPRFSVRYSNEDHPVTASKRLIWLGQHWQTETNVSKKGGYRVLGDSSHQLKLKSYFQTIECWWYSLFLLLTNFWLLVACCLFRVSLTSNCLVFNRSSRSDLVLFLFLFSSINTAVWSTASKDATHSVIRTFSV